MKLARVARGEELYSEVHEWLDDEAALLDSYEFDEWLSRLDPAINYLMPVRETVLAKDGLGLDGGYSHFEENFGSLAFRVKHQTNANCWSENPRSRCRRMVSNVRVFVGEGGEVVAKSYLLLLRSRGDAAVPELLSCEREDTFSRGDQAQLKLANRYIAVDQATLGVSHLLTLL